ncbi:MAG TPA: MgtC/SapB family protein [Polyangiaceae bacterium]|nr:MgtC/SapB family protein [Polyangiaceae bacterium]
MATWLWTWLAPVEPVLRLLIATLLGALVGWDRQHQNKPAGTRTHMLISLGAAAFTLGPFSVAAMDLESTSRVIQGVAGGMGLLAAGSIIQSKDKVSGITTAVSVWACGGIGAACGLGNYLVATSAAVIATLVLLIGRMHDMWERSRIKPAASSSLVSTDRARSGHTADAAPGYPTQAHSLSPSNQSAPDHP